MNHVSSTSEPRFAPRGPSAETPARLVREREIRAPLTATTAPTPQARGGTVHARVITPTEGLAEFDWVI